MRVAWKHAAPYVKQIASEDLLCDAGSSNVAPCDNAEGWDEVGGGRVVLEGGAYVYLQLIHGDVRQKPTEYCKATDPPIKNIF